MVKPMTKTTDWEEKWDRLEKFIYYKKMFDGSDDRRECVDAFQAKQLVRKLLADARREVIEEIKGGLSKLVLEYPELETVMKSILYDSISTLRKEEKV